ncbi:hypothetical protein [Streptomyces alkaliterrae]|uniref:Uncharacterized protein n=1 Tax=Streptomyces alkaliterrae TaxID=2213162 RepID=A0A5P0YUW7_9ACTN|nr:hypothetical protein [Streptomyces alkaliterrae]MBB1255283.1 hypothetical protein [Streptomyces alkaliterrae]MBB1261570.1 hypothetical protein [Streptomyces alkaliterrae]MQS04088.1 hypothetical protein [Streptomyces alkaliterrae]
MTEREQGRGEGREPLDEEAAWAQIVAGYDKESPDPPGERRELTDLPDGAAPDGDAERDDDPLRKRPAPAPGGTATDLAEDRPDDVGDDARDANGDGPGERDGEGDGRPPQVRSVTVYAAGTGPRDWQPAEPPEEDDHFVPPEPPPLPKLDTAAKFAWLAVLGGPALLFGSVLLGLSMSWWVVTLGVGGFLGGFATLVARMRDGRDDEDWEDPGRGAVV